MKVKIIEVKNLFCLICEDKVSEIMKEIEGVLEYKTNIYTKEIYMKYDPTKVRFREILRTLNEKGFLTSDSGSFLRKECLLLFLFVVFHFHWIFINLNDSIVSLLVSSAFQYYNLKDLLMFHSFNKNFVVTISSFLCYLLGIWMFLIEEYTVVSIEYLTLSINIFTFILISSMLLALIVNMTKLNLYSISQIQRKFVKKLDINKEKIIEFQTLALEKLLPGDVICLNIGYVYVDGTIIKGACLVDESDISGEDCLKQRKKNDKIYSSTKIIDGDILLRVDRVGKESYTGKILSLIEDSSFKNIFCRNKTPSFYTSCVLCTSLVVATGFFFRSLDVEDLYPKVFRMFISTMISLCPCVFVVSEPLIALKARKYLLSQNIIVNNFSHVFECSPKVVFLDKTGTLTKGFSEVQDYRIYKDLERNASIIMNMEEKYQNTVYGSVYRLMKSIKGDFINTTNIDVFYISGSGIRCCYDSQEIRLGKKSFATNSSSQKKSLVEKYHKKERIVYFSIQFKIEGYFILSDNINPSAHLFVQTLKKEYSKVIVLSGDQKANVEKVSRSLGIEEYFYEQTSKDKMGTIMNYFKEGKPSIMIGDGTNDIPAFRASGLSISVNLNNTSADVILLSDDLNGILVALQYFKKMHYKNLTNYIFAVMYNLIVFIWLIQTKTDSIDISCISMMASLTFIVVNSLLF
ncbi:putative copper-exporting P-type ATPase [Nosema granulosis]|uniref:Copper-exporting P-type ATPase n=1 Tax=Nosema granulosis TaxID=83296 RepID=A0A9P6GZV2_9MICR|nr:putative copper-exporting P-type ATPase [Nosema granulosis]